LDGFKYPSIKEEVHQLVKKDFIEYGKKGQFVANALNLLSPYIVCNEAEGAFYLFPSFVGILKLPYVKDELKITNDKELSKWLLAERGFAALAGSDFGKMGLGHIRFSYAEDRGKHIIPGIKHILKTMIELIEKSGQLAPLKMEEVEAKVGEIERRCFIN
jgi:aspartate/methionine/tyrosine aminotransferase